jgi:hypothetical protein
VTAVEEPTAKPVAASDGEGSFTAPAAEDAKDSTFGGDDYLAASLLAIATEKLDVAFPEGAMGISVGNSEEDSSVLYVEMVVPGSVADQGGVKAGDVVSAVNGDHDAVVSNHTPDLFVAYVTPLVRPITLTFERTDDAAAKAPVAEPVAASEDEGSFATAAEPVAEQVTTVEEPTAKPVAASDGEGSFTAPAAAEDAKDSTFGGDEGSFAPAAPAEETSVGGTGSEVAHKEVPAAVEAAAEAAPAAPTPQSFDYIEVSFPAGQMGLSIVAVPVRSIIASSILQRSLMECCCFDFPSFRRSRTTTAS